MVVHKILRGANAGLYLPFGMARLRALEAIDPRGFFAQKYIIGGYSIEVQQSPPFQYVRIYALAPFVHYEMFTPDHVQDSTLSSPGHSGGPGLTDNFVCGSASRTGFAPGNSVGTALSSSLINGSWVMRDCESLDMRTLNFWTKLSWQNQKFFEHCWHPNNDGKSLVTSCQAQAPGLGGQCGWMSAYAWRRLASPGSMVSDFGLDVQPTLYTKTNTFRGAPIYDQPWIYYRRAAVKTVGNRSFFVSSDNYGRFQIYPVKSYEASEGLVDTYYQLTPPYPGWVTVPSPDDWTCQINDWLWRFNKDCSKCVAIAYHSDFPGNFWKYEDGMSYMASMTATIAAKVHPDYANQVVPAREDTPGLVEFGIEITITGPGEWDFTPKFTLLRNQYFGTGKRYFFDAAYFMKDVEHKVDDPKYVAEDTLVTAEIECSYPAGYYLAARPDGYAVDSACNVQGFCTINLLAEGSTAVAREVRRFPLIGGNGQFATAAGYDSSGNYRGGIGNYLPLTNVTTGAVSMTFVANAGPVNWNDPPPPFTSPDQMPNFAFRYSFLYSMELSTLSLCYQVDDAYIGVATQYVIAYGDEVKAIDVPLGFTHPPPTVPMPDTQMPALRWYHQLLQFVINTEWGGGFSVHPHGHWGHSCNGELQGSKKLGTWPNWAADLDIVSVKEKDGKRSRYTHKQLFNNAFGQNRDYEFYAENYPGQQYYDNGSFRSAAIWVTYRP